MPKKQDSVWYMNLLLPHSKILCIGFQFVLCVVPMNVVSLLVVPILSCRCNLAVMLLADLVMDCMDIDWVVHLPIMLHVIFLGKYWTLHLLTYVTTYSLLNSALSSANSVPST